MSLPLDGVDPAALLKRADVAMYAGKQGGKRCVQRADATMTARRQSSGLPTAA